MFPLSESYHKSRGTLQESPLVSTPFDNGDIKPQTVGDCYDTLNASTALSPLKLAYKSGTALIESRYLFLRVAKFLSATTNGRSQFFYGIDDAGTLFRKHSVLLSYQ
jgi:hypothetical protein